MGLNLEYLTAWAAICALLLVITPTQAQQQQQQELDQGDGKTVKPMYSFDVGPLTVDTFVNETEYKDKLRLRKGYMKYVVSSKQLGGNMLPLSTMKISVMEELVRCENLTLQDSDMLAHIECMPLDYFVTDGTARGSGGNKLYTRRRSMRFKQKSMWSMGLGIKSGGTQMGYGYDLKDDYVNAMISGELKSLQLANSPHIFSASTIDKTGFYMEFQNGEIICSGSLLTAHDESKFAAPPKALGMDDMAEHFQVLLKHGALISLPDFTCRKENDLIGFAISTPITLAWQPEQFPYLTVKHQIITSPLEQFWKYSGSITQQRDESTWLGSGPKPQAYNTTIKLNSRSIFTPLFFNLNQTFAHASEHDGWEQMILSSPSFSAIVDGAWTMDTLVKSLRLLWPVEGESDASKWPKIELRFADAPDQSEDIMFTLNMSRKLLAQWLANDGEQAQQDNSATTVHEEL